MKNANKLCCSRPPFYKLLHSFRSLLFSRLKAKYLGCSFQSTISSLSNDIRHYIWQSNSTNSPTPYSKAAWLLQGMPRPSYRPSWGRKCLNRHHLALDSQRSKNTALVVVLGSRFISIAKDSNSFKLKFIVIHSTDIEFIS